MESGQSRLHVLLAHTQISTEPCRRLHLSSKSSKFLQSAQYERDVGQSRGGLVQCSMDVFRRYFVRNVVFVDSLGFRVGGMLGLRARN